MKKGFKKLFMAALILVMGVVAVGCGGNPKQTLTVYNWGGYIDESVLRDFEKEFDVRIVYETFATNEDMYVKIRSGGSNYDVAFPSDYMIERMIKEDLLHEINMDKITNYHYIDEPFRNLAFDPENKYSVPYMWGTVGIIYNTKMVEEPVDSWEVLWDEKYKGQVLMLDSQRDAIGVTLKKLGFSLNSKDPQELEMAKQELIRQKPLVLSYVGDEGLDMMIGEEAAVSIAWNGAAVTMTNENENLRYIVPKEGSNLWFDNMVIPKTSKNRELAEEFINFLTRPEIAVKNTTYIGYSTANKGAMELLPPEVLNNEIGYPSRATIERCEVFLDPGDTVAEYDRIWTEVKAH